MTDPRLSKIRTCRSPAELSGFVEQTKRDGGWTAELAKVAQKMFEEWRK